MISGPNIMPVVGEINPTEGMAGWKSPFKHESEIIQPGYHRLYLDRYKTLGGVYGNRAGYILPFELYRKCKCQIIGGCR